MAQPQPRGGGGQMPPQQQQQQPAPAQQAQHQGPIKYGDAFDVKGDLAAQPIAPRDAAAMRSAEEGVPGVQVPQEKGGGFSAAGFMEKAAEYNQAVGAVRPGQASEAAARQGVNLTQDPVPGGRIVTEFVAGQAVAQYAKADPPAAGGAQQAAPAQGGAGNQAPPAGGMGGAAAGATAARRTG